jgi:hypothetical protein
MTCFRPIYTQQDLVFHDPGQAQPGVRASQFVLGSEVCYPVIDWISRAAPLTAKPE